MNKPHSADGCGDKMPVKRKRLHLTLEAWKRLVLKLDPSRSSLTRRMRTLYWLGGTMHSLLSRIQAKSFANALADCVPFPPIFILGFWRSGTTFLHELLCCDRSFGFPSTYACLNPSHFLLSDRQGGKARTHEYVHRPMDNMLYSWSSPQEDEFALLALGAPSPYEALLVPSLMRRPESLLDLQQLPAPEQDRWSSTLQYFLRLLTIQQPKPMLLKSPSHGFRFATLQSLFPQARYIAIERNPYEVFASNLKLWSTLLSMYSLEQCLPEEIEEFVLAAYIIHERSISKGTAGLNHRVVAQVRYEDLIVDPLKELARLYSELELGSFETTKRRVEEHLTSVTGYKRNRFQLSARQKTRVDERWGRIISEKRYDWPSARLDS